MAPSGRVRSAVGATSRPEGGCPRSFVAEGVGSWAVALPPISLGRSSLLLILLLLPMWPMLAMGTTTRGTAHTRHWPTRGSPPGLTCAPRFTLGEPGTTNENGTTNRDTAVNVLSGVVKERVQRCVADMPDMQATDAEVSKSGTLPSA